jgi:branched-chain amino acid transport system permease protein
MADESQSETSQGLSSWQASAGQRIATFFEPFSGPQTLGSSSRFWTGFLITVAVILVLPGIMSTYRIGQYTVFLIWIFLAWSLTLIWGYTGIFSFGQTAFFGIGGYTFGVVGINLINITGATNVAIVAAILVPALFAAAAGYFMFYGRVSGIYVAIITLAITLILSLGLSRTSGAQYEIGSARLGGENGMTNIPTLTLGIDPVTFRFDTLAMYYLVIVLLVVCFLAIRYIMNTGYGYSLIAVRENESRAKMFGYDIRFVKLSVFTVAGGLAGMGGAFYASWGGFISPPIMGLVAAALPIIWITVGGRQTVLGSAIAVFVLQYIDNELAVYGTQYAQILMGLILIIAVMRFEGGVVPYLARAYESWSNPDSTQTEA